MTASQTANVVNHRNEPYLAGVYAPVVEERDEPRLAVTGELPDGLAGMFVRNGPNQMFEPKGRYHLFDGDGMLHAVSIAGDGSACYRNRWIQTDGLAAEQRAQRAIYGGMANGEFPSPEETGGGPAMKNVANTNVIRHAGRILALWEAGLPTEVTPTLDTVGPFDFAGTYAGPFTAHPKLDAITGEMFTFGYSPIPPFLRYHVVDADGRLVSSVAIDLPAPVMMHDFAITERHAIFFDAPAVFDFDAFSRGEPMLAWKPELGTRIGVMDRYGDGSDLTWIETDPCYVFHFLNAFATDEGLIHLDACRLARMDIGLSDANGTAEPDSWMHRFTLDTDAGSIRYDQVAELPGDFPRVPAALEGRRHRHGYYATFSSGVPQRGDFDSVTKVDFETTNSTTHRYGPNAVAGEAVFAADPSGTREDDGWLLNYVTDRTTMTTDMVVLAAADLSEVARVHLPLRVPFGFHGNWLPAAV